jgi:hypothetical protein
LPAIVGVLKARGFEFVTVKEFLLAGEPVWSQECYDSRPGDTYRYDAHARGLEPEYQIAREAFLAAKSRLARETKASAVASKHVKRAQ